MIVPYTFAETLATDRVQQPEGSNEMSKGKFIAYYRCSTTRQGTSGLGLEAQRDAVRSYLNGGNWTLVDEVTEVESGTRSDRPKLGEAMRLCRLYGATLIIAKIDRLARNVAFISNLMDAGVDFTAVDFPQANRLTVHILAAMAEFEAEQISKRTRAALAVKREWLATRTPEQRAHLEASGKKTRLGGNPMQFVQVRHLGNAASALVRGQRATKRAADLAPTVRELQASGLSLNAVAAELTRRGVATPRAGCRWTTTQLTRILGRA